MSFGYFNSRTKEIDNYITVDETLFELQNLPDI